MLVLNYSTRDSHPVIWTGYILNPNSCHLDSLQTRFSVDLVAVTFLCVYKLNTQEIRSV
jgi:hypothetical protein